MDTQFWETNSPATCSRVRLASSDVSNYMWHCPVLLSAIICDGNTDNSRSTVYNKYTPGNKTCTDGIINRRFIVQRLQTIKQTLLHFNIILVSQSQFPQEISTPYTDRTCSVCPAHPNAINLTRLIAAEHYKPQCCITTPSIIYLHDTIQALCEWCEALVSILNLQTL
jgi:hypothetical protein